MTVFSSLYQTLLHFELGTDDRQNLFTDSRRKLAINKGLQEFVDLTECVVRQVVFSVTGGTSEYDLNSAAVIPAGDFVRLAKDGIELTYTDASSNITIVGGDDLVRRDIVRLNREEPGWRLSTGAVASSVMQIPDTYYLRADGPALFLGFEPVPSTGSSASMTCRLNYYPYLSPLTSDTSEPFTFNSSVRTDLRPYHQAAVHYGAHQLEKLRKDDQAADQQLQKFLGYVSRFLQNMRIKGGRVISQRVNYFNRERSQ